jgi:molybdopterin molybdotransferase
MHARAKQDPMDSGPEQKIARLTPFAKILAALDDLARPVKPREVASADAAGFILAADVVGASLPARATALGDGWAVRADELSDASAYAPVQLANRPVRVEAGDALPPDADAVAPPDVIALRDDRVEAVDAVTTGEGVALAGSEVDEAKSLRAAGHRIRAVDLAVFEAAGIQTVSVRTPRILIVAAREDLRLQPALRLISKDCTARGGEACVRNGVDLGDALAAEDCDAIVVIGGSGTGRRDRSVHELGRAGEVLVHGIGITPGETAALGRIATRPVLIVPGQLDAALAVWLTFGRTLLARLAGPTEVEIPATVTLSRKIPSTVGLAELVLVRRDGNRAEPLASKHLTLSALSAANAWLLVPAESEGFPAGAQVAIYGLP